MIQLQMRDNNQESKHVWRISALLAALILLATGCVSLLYPSSTKTMPLTGAVVAGGNYYEATRDDAFAVKDVSSLFISVLGVHLGSSMEEVIAAVGKPDVQTAPVTDVMNWEYRESLGLEKIGLLFHFENGTVTRITAKTPFNPRLQGNMVINHTKEDLYRLFGKPDKIQLLSGLTVYSYHDQGIDIIMDGSKQNGFSLMYPQPEKARENTRGQEVVTSNSIVLVPSAS